MRKLAYGHCQESRIRSGMTFFSACLRLYERYDLSNQVFWYGYTRSSPYLIRYKTTYFIGGRKPDGPLLEYFQETLLELLLQVELISVE